MAIDPDFWLSRRVLLTGHTGFKGAWLSLWLQSLGARVTGLSPGPPTDPSLYRLARVADGMEEHVLDVRDATALSAALERASPEIVFHLAGQPLVRRSLRDPALTYEVNLMGTVNLLEAVRRAGAGVRAVVVVTSDKCYENVSGRARRFVEEDPLGGADPYSSSKACAELATAAYRDSFFAGPDATQVATARAGNVIGGGDWGQDRLLPDALRAVEAGASLSVRHPEAVRPWQHVLNPLGGYLLLAESLGRSPAAARGWNFGPGEDDSWTVAAVLELLAELWHGALHWHVDESAGHPPEASHLALDSALARSQLGWRPALDVPGALRLFVDWNEALRRGEDMRAVSLAQIESWAPAR